MISRKRQIFRYVRSSRKKNGKHWVSSQLNDLQSKLMLVAGKAQEGKQDVDTFVEASSN